MQRTPLCCDVCVAVISFLFPKTAAQYFNNMKNKISYSSDRCKKRVNLKPDRLCPGVRSTLQPRTHHNISQWVGSGSSVDVQHSLKQALSAGD